MSKLDELIKEFCPDGVEYKCLSEIGQVKMCKRILKAQTNAIGEIPFYKIGTFGGKANAFISEDLFNEYKEKYSYPKIGEILISAAGTIGRTVVYNGESAYYQDSNIVWLSHDESMILNTFLRYCYELKPWNVSSGGTIARLYNDNILKARIPVPPLEVQREIVRILDNFTSLKAELQAELQARKKQYEYYRDKLLSFASDIPLFQLGKVCDLQAGKAIKASEISDIETNQETIPCYGANGLRGYVGKSNQKGDKSIIGRQGAQCGNVCYATGKYYATEHAVVVTDKGYFNSRYLFHVLTHANLNQYKTAGAQPGLSVSKLNNVMIAVPDKKVQDKIANILDNFEKICSDLNIGLPAEIEARQKQYEYYRDALLSFDNSYFVNVERERER